MDLITRKELYNYLKNEVIVVKDLSFEQKGETTNSYTGFLS